MLFERTEILRTWRTFRQPGEVLELRVPKAGRFKTISGYFDNPEMFADAVVALADEPFAGIYFTINPVKADLLSRAANRYVKYAETTTSDADIVALHWLPIDLDASRPAGISATNEEHDAAIVKAFEIRDSLIENLGWPAGAFVIADSGNGAHVNVRIDMPNTPENVGVVRVCLEALAFLFSDDMIAVDTTSQNPARIWKIYGTMARKGDNTQDRPHRLARILEMGEGEEIVSLSLLKDLASLAPAPEETPTSYRSGGFDPVAYCQDHGLSVHHTKPYQGGTLAVLDECIFNPDHKLSACIIGWSSGARTYRCRHYSCLDKRWADAKAVIEGENHPPQEHKVENIIFTGQENRQATVVKPSPRPIVAFPGDEPLTGRGNAERLIRLFGERMRFNHTDGRWYLWDGSVWHPDSNGGAFRRAEEVVKEIYRYASEAEDAKDRGMRSSWARRCDSMAGYRELLDLAKNKHPVTSTHGLFDQDPWLLNCQNGTLDLQSGEFREADPSKYITKVINCAHDPKADAPLWKAFLKDIFRTDQNEPDEELISFVQMAIGYSLTGSMAEQLFFFCYGAGANGKSVFLSIIRELMGDYARQTDFNTFLVQRNESVRNDVAALAGARFITALESEEGKRLAMALIKSWTGGDPITARFLHQEYFTFSPVGKLWFASNTKPVITERNKGAWRRVCMIPFTISIPPEMQDPDLEECLKTELPGILNWALEGLKKYLEVGKLEMPPSVKNAINLYRDEFDSIGAFIQSRLEFDSNAYIMGKELYAAYNDFCEDVGYNPVSKKKFNQEIESEPGVMKVDSRHSIKWLGIELLGETIDTVSNVSYRGRNLDKSYVRDIREKTWISSHIAHIAHTETNLTKSEAFKVPEEMEQTLSEMERQGDAYNVSAFELEWDLDEGEGAPLLEARGWEERSPGIWYPPTRM
jgi:P4 family phage/plasmid primase-like protien